MNDPELDLSSFDPPFPLSSREKWRRTFRFVLLVLGSISISTFVADLVTFSFTGSSGAFAFVFVYAFLGVVFLVLAARLKE